MYTTKVLSLYKDSPEAISICPEGPNSGFLVLQDEKSIPTRFFGLFKDPYIHNLPLPQDKRISIEYQSGPHHDSHEVYLIPVINQPLSSNRYYAIKVNGSQRGQAYASSKDEDHASCFCFPCIEDVQPRPLDAEDIYQQFKFSESLEAKSVAPDGQPPLFLRRSGWLMKAKYLKNSALREARGIDSSLRVSLPDFSFPLSQECSKSVVVGKWYCPFMFIKDGRVKDQIEQSVFYKMTLEQRWEKIFAAEKSSLQGKVVKVDVMVPIKVIRIAGQEAMQEERVVRGVVWFKTIDGGASDERVGLSSLIVERIIWEEERVGLVRDKEKKIRVIKDDEYQGIMDWRSYGFYVLVETFVLKRNDGTVVLTCEFRHTHQVRSKWE